MQSLDAVRDLCNQAAAELALGRVQAALAAVEEAVRSARTCLSEGHHGLPMAMVMYAHVLVEASSPNEALQVAGEVEILTQRLDDYDLENAVTINKHLVALYGHLGEIARAQAVCNKTIKLLESSHGAEHPWVALNRRELLRAVAKTDDI